LDSRRRTVIGIVLVGATAAMMIAGYVFGDPLMIFRKAASICLECIGVG
jgi:hypothetical protein